MDNELQVSLSVLLAAAVQLNSAFYHVTAAYVHRRKDIQQTVTVAVLSSTVSQHLPIHTLMAGDFLVQSVNSTCSLETDTHTLMGKQSGAI